MYKINDVSTGNTIAAVEKPDYVKLLKNGCTKRCSEEEAQGVGFRGQIYNLLGKGGIANATSTVVLIEFDAGETIRNAESSVKISPQIAAASKFYVRAMSANVPDTQALEMPDLFETWDEALSSGEKLEKDTIINDGGTLYRVVQADGVTPQEHQPPHGDGMLAVYRPIDQSHAGTIEDPIPWIYGMDCKTGQYFSYNGTVYLCKGDMIPCVWTPGSAGLWQWEAVSQ